MPTYFHVTKLSNVRSIAIHGIKVSTGMTAGGMSADSSEAYKYSEQDRNLVYLWTDVDYSDKFKKEGAQYALIEVDVDLEFDTAHIDVTVFARRDGKIKGVSELTTLVSDAAIPLKFLFYYKSEEAHQKGERTPLSEWGRFDMKSDKRDESIWEGRT
ncbi:MAG: hypothetical protein KF850_22735 [Labilithrix sp.]|nr:hypothetical protein [Labilithrix sp.]